MVRNWSLQLAEPFHLNLPADVAAWFDSEIWKKESWVGFGYPLTPEEIPHTMWGGAMLPDTLPVLGNGCGDYLCLRIHPNGSVSELVSWLHEGGLWNPYGNTLCEALLFDAALDLRKEPASTDLGDQTDPLVFATWALKRLGGQAALKGTIAEELSLEGLLAAGLAEAAVRRELCKERWASGLLTYSIQAGGEQLAEKLGVKWPEFSRWFIDTQFIPDKFKSKLARITRRPIEKLLQQDWEGANQEAEKVSKLRTDLAWPFAVMGWAAERRGYPDLAVGHYCAGLKTPEPSADFTADWVTDRRFHNKFVIERLSTLQEILPQSTLEDGYLQAALAASNAAECFSRIRGYWLEQGEKAEEQGFHERAYWCYYSAGWDLYCFDDIAEILARLVRAAQSAGWPALCRLAQVHLEQVTKL